MIDPSAFATFPVLDTSMSQLDTWSRCDRRYMYRYVRGLVPVGASDAMIWGTLFHRAAQEYYRSIQSGLTEASANVNVHWIIDNTTKVENQYHGDSEITLSQEQRETMHDCWDYYYQQTASKDEWDEIVKVEDPIFLVIGYNGQPVLRIRSTLDMIARKNGKLVVVDHKTTGDVEQSVEFLALDFQVREYPLAVRAYYEEDPIVCYNMIAREVPPGFGRRPLTTDTGRKRNADTLANMQRPERYLRREWLSFSEAQHNSFQLNLVQIALALQFEGNAGIWPRRIVKMGGMACSGCPYFAICTAELDGRKIADDAPLVTMAFTRDPLLEKPKIYIPPSGSPFAR
jgi:hypothetical protein